MTSSPEVSAAKPRIDLADLSIATVAGLALAFTTLFLCVVPLVGNIAGSRDFVVFWATGQQLIHHANPYDATAMKQIERSAGLNTGYNVLFMRNPPWALPLALPLGFFGLRSGAVFWSMAIVACLLASVLILWRIEGRPEPLALDRAFVRTRLDMLHHGADHAVRAAWLRSVSCFAPHALLSGRNGPLALPP